MTRRVDGHTAPVATDSPASSDEWWVLEIAPDADIAKPGIYRRLIEGGGVYIGKYAHKRRPTKAYRRNVERLLKGLPSHHPNGAFRRVHHALADAVRDGRRISLTILVLQHIH